MKITKTTYRYENGNPNPDRIRRQVLYDTDAPKNGNKGIGDRIYETLEALERKFESGLGWVVDIIG
jgi:hypothetical protein